MRVTLAFLSICALCSADTITLKSGGIVEGTYLGGDARNVRVAVGDRVDSYPVSEISTIQFRHDAPPKQTSTRAPDGLERRSTAGPVIPAGTALIVKMIDPVNSENDRAGQNYRGSVEEAVVVDGQTVIPRGAQIVARLVNDGAAPRVDLAQVQVNGRPLDVAGSVAGSAAAHKGFTRGSARRNTPDLHSEPAAAPMRRIIMAGAFTSALLFAASQHVTEGIAESPVRVIIYEDLQCPDCADFRHVLDEKLLPKYQSKVTFEHRDFPLAKHAWARRAAIAGRYIAEIKPALASDYRRFAMARQDEITAANFNGVLERYAREHGMDAAKVVASEDDPKLAAAVQADFEEGVARGIAHTPTVLVNGRAFVEHFTYEEVAQAIDAELAANK